MAATTTMAAVVAVYLLLPTASLAFAPSLSSFFHTHNNAHRCSHHHQQQQQQYHHRRYHLASSSRIITKQHFASSEETEDVTKSTATATSWNIGTPSRQILEASKKKQIAKTALHKLLDRQQRDVQQTMDLLHSLELDYNNFDMRQWIDDDGYNNSWDSMEVADEEDVVGAIGHKEANITSSPSQSTLPSTASSITASVVAGVDYGYISRSEGCRFEIINYRGEREEDARFMNYGPPGNIFELGTQQFMRNLRAMIGEYSEEVDERRGDLILLTEQQQYLQSQLQQLTLDTKKIWEREHSRSPIVAPYIIKVPYYALCFFLDVVFEGKNPFGRFFMLETVARMPYFSFITMLHLYETLGFWRRSADIKRIHFAEEWNEVRGT